MSIELSILKGALYIGGRALLRGHMNNKGNKKDRLIGGSLMNPQGVDIFLLKTHHLLYVKASSYHIECTLLF